MIFSTFWCAVFDGNARRIIVAALKNLIHPNNMASQNQSENKSDLSALDTDALKGRLGELRRYL
tara:strand:- start:819 stop:1010 length:192 start_codon:yes stop_codon:yes gene_type:complete